MGIWKGNRLTSLFLKILPFVPSSARNFTGHGLGERAKAVNHWCLTELTSRVRFRCIRETCDVYADTIPAHSVDVCAQGLPEILSLMSIHHHQPCAPPRASELGVTRADKALTRHTC